MTWTAFAILAMFLWRRGYSKDCSRQPPQQQEIRMDAIRKKMKSIKDETDQLYAIIGKFENATKEADTISKEVGINPWKIEPK